MNGAARVPQGNNLTSGYAKEPGAAMAPAIHVPGSQRLRVMLCDNSAPIVETRLIQRKAPEAGAMETKHSIGVDADIPRAQEHGAGRHADPTTDLNSGSVRTQLPDLFGATINPASEIAFYDKNSRRLLTRGHWVPPDRAHSCTQYCLHQTAHVLEPDHTLTPILAIPPSLQQLQN